MNHEQIILYALPAGCLFYAMGRRRFQQNVIRTADEDRAMGALFSFFAYALIASLFWGYGRYYAYVWLDVDEEHTLLFNIVCTLILLAILQWITAMEMKIRQRKAAKNGDGQHEPNGPM